MADTGAFRSKFGGFNKDDVLQYINSLQEEQMRQLDEVQQQAAAQREAYEKALNDANAALAEQFQSLQDERAEQDKLQALINEQYETSRVLHEEIETTKIALSEEQAKSAQCAALQQETAELKQRLATAERERADFETERTEWQQKLAAREQEVALVGTLKQQLAQAQEQAQQALSRRDRLDDQNQRYQQLVGDVGGFVVEVRAMGQRYLEDANARCQDRLTAISDAIAALGESLALASEELSAADNALVDQNSSAEQRLDELAREIENSAADMMDESPVAGKSPAQFF